VPFAYYPRKSRALPSGYQILSDRGRQSLIRGTTLLVEGFPKGIFKATAECTRRMIGLEVADPQLKTLEARSGIVRSPQHLAALRQLQHPSQASTGQASSNTEAHEDEEDPLVVFFDETFQLLKANIENSAREMGVRLSSRFDRELTYVLLYIFIILLLKNASSNYATRAAERLSRFILESLVHLEGVKAGEIAQEYRSRFQEYATSKLFTMADTVLMKEEALVLGRHLTGKNQMLFGAIAMNILTAILEAVRDRIVSLRD